MARSRSSARRALGAASWALQCCLEQADTADRCDVPRARRDVARQRPDSGRGDCQAGVGHREEQQRYVHRRRRCGAHDRGSAEQAADHHGLADLRTFAPWLLLAVMAHSGPRRIEQSQRASPPAGQQHSAVQAGPSEKRNAPGAIYPSVSPTTNPPRRSPCVTPFARRSGFAPFYITLTQSGVLRDKARPVRPQFHPRAPRRSTRPARAGSAAGTEGRANVD